MAFIKDVFRVAGKERPAIKKAPVGIPTDKILVMRQKGLSNDQIIQNLKAEGYKTHQIFDALNQADIKKGIEFETPQKGDNMPEEPYPGQPAPPEQPTEYPQPYPEQGPYFEAAPGREQIEEIAEAIIDEKWSDLMKNVDKIIEWKDKTEARIVAIEQQFNDLKENFDRLHASILEKVGQYDQNLQNVATDIKALEKVFQKILPGFMENINELSRITDNLKKKK